MASTTDVDAPGADVVEDDSTLTVEDVLDEATAPDALEQVELGFMVPTAHIAAAAPGAGACADTGIVDGVKGGDGSEVATVDSSDTSAAADADAGSNASGSGAGAGAGAGASAGADAGAGAGTGAAAGASGGDTAESTETLNASTLLHRTANWTTWDGGKAGGKPVWLDPEHIPKRDRLLCDGCGKQMVFLLQVYAPVDGDNAAAFHRSLYVFCCSNAGCVAAGSVVVLRCQLPQENDYYPATPPKTVVSFTPPRSAPSCAVCGVYAPNTCARCGLVRYCCRDHQTLHWKTSHSASCRPKGTSEPSPAAAPKPRRSRKRREPVTFTEWAVEVETEMGASEREAARTANDAQLLKKFGGASKEKDESVETMTMSELNDTTGGKLDADATMLAFNRRISSQPAQVLRYCRWKDHAALWVRDDQRAKVIPPCKCGAPRQFEFQILPQLLYFLHDTSSDEGALPCAPKLDFGTIAVFTCTACCDLSAREGEQPFYPSEFAWVQTMA